MLRRFIVVTAAALALGALHVSPAAAQTNTRGNPPPGPEGNPGRGHTGTHSIPEFDPTTAGAIGAVLAGGVILVARRRRR